MKKTLVLVSCALAGFLSAAQAQTLYKLVDKNGKITYSETAPKPGEFDGQVIPLNIDPKANTMVKPTLPPRNAGQEAAEAASRSATVQQAQEKLEAAKKALAMAQNSQSEEDVRYVGNKGGGTRPVFSDKYQAKLDKLEAEVKAAEEELRRVEGR
jgi:hypothetical protein